ncbi:MAG: hypothetical protein J3Q66DRAFT_432708 [Benniella sp.]|nr:MAG: hypothetical protein J3Q66DRAFT_432708 [Benniella sp.]
MEGSRTKIPPNFMTFMVPASSSLVAFSPHCSPHRFTSPFPFANNLSQFLSGWAFLIPHALLQVQGTRSTPLPPRGQHYVIAKSNTNPASFTEMTWSTVATISSAAFGMLHYIITACVVSGQGVVTIFDYNYKVIRYDPSATPNGGTASTRPGGWMQINVSNTFTLSRRGHMKSLAFYVKDTAAGGVQKLVHLTLTSSTLQFGIVDETTKTLSHAADWTITVGSLYTTVRSVAFSNNQLYVYWGDGSMEARVSVYPLTVLTSTVPSYPRTLNATNTDNICSSSRNILSGVWGNSYHLLCTFSAGGSRANTLYTINNIAQNGSSAGSGINIPTALDEIEYFIPIASTPYFAIMLDADGTGYLPQGTYGIQVSGVGTGTVQGPKNITVQDLNVPTYPTDRNADSGSDSTGAIIGVFIGILVVVVVITVCCYRKRSSDNNNEKKKHAAETTANQEYNGRHNPTEVKGEETLHIVEPVVMPMTQSPGDEWTISNEQSKPAAFCWSIPSDAWTADVSDVTTSTYCHLGCYDDHACGNSSVIPIRSRPHAIPPVLESSETKLHHDSRRQ